MVSGGWSDAVVAGRGSRVWTQQWCDAFVTASSGVGATMGTG